MTRRKPFEYEITQHVAVLAGDTTDVNDYTKQVNWISFNGDAPVLDLRKWHGNSMLKGITLTRSEAQVLLNVLKEIFEPEGTEKDG